MGMPRLKCRVAQVRAQHLLTLSDYRAAAEAAQQALQIATQHDMELRKISALSLLGGAMLKLEAIEARTLLNRARELAQHAEFYAEINRIEALLATG